MVSVQMENSHGKSETLESTKPSFGPLTYFYTSLPFIIIFLIKIKTIRIYIFFIQNYEQNCSKKIYNDLNGRKLHYYLVINVICRVVLVTYTFLTHGSTLILLTSLD